MPLHHPTVCAASTPRTALPITRTVVALALLCTASLCTSSLIAQATTDTLPTPRAAAALAPSLVVAPTDVVDLCIVPGSGTAYRVASTGVPTQCVSRTHTRLLMNRTGPQGIAGDSGVAGPAGLPGAPGVAGAEGPAGPAGTPGAAGANGAAGVAGAVGATGPAGSAGTVGPAGAAGTPGAVGPTGPACDVGPAGTPGAPGSAGTPGTAGADGAMGPVGPAGPQGAAGSAGVTSHALLTNLTADDHPQYLIAGTRQAYNGFAVTGAVYTGAPAVAGAGTRFVWNPRKGAIRAGTVYGASSAVWDDASIGQNSTAFGENTTASGRFSFAVGQGSVATSDYAAALGLNARATGIASFTAGGNATGTQTVALGDGSNASGTKAIAIGGGSNSTAQASIAIGNSQAWGDYAVALGSNNVADGQHAVTIGTNAHVGHDGTVIISAGWNGTGSLQDVASENFGEIVLRSTGGTTVYSNENGTAGVRLLPGNGSWDNLSDRNRKERFADVDGETLLRQLRAVPVSSWNYISQARSRRHVGPMAQDWAKAFALSADSTTINSGDIAGVTLAGVQALDVRTRGTAEHVATLEGRIATLEQQLIAAVQALQDAMAERRQR